MHKGAGGGDGGADLPNKQVSQCSLPSLALTPDRIAEIFGISVNRVETPDGPLLLPSRAL